MDVGRISGVPAARLAGAVSSYDGYREESPSPLRRREGPGRDIVLIISFGEDWLIDGERLTSFVAGLRNQQVTTEHAGRSFGMHVNVAPPAAYMLLALPLHSLAHHAVPIEDVLDEPFLVERLHSAGDWPARFRLIDSVLAKRLEAARPPSAELVWAWRRLVETDGRLAIGALAEELGWSRKRIAARFREQIGLPPKAFARLLRFERARAVVEGSRQRPDWARVALECGYYDQSHLVNDFRAFSGRTPETFFQDPERRRPSLRLMTQTVTPYLLYEEGEAAIEFLTSVFGFREVDRAVGGAGGLNAELEVAPGGGRIYLGQPPGDFQNPATVGRTCHVYVLVDNAEVHYARARDGGATIIEELNDLPFGHRRYGCVDPQGHEWYFAQVIAGEGGE